MFNLYLGRFLRLLTYLLFFFVRPAWGQVVISQVYGGGGATTGSPAFKNDYVELFNRGSSPVDLTGYSMQYASATSGTWSLTILSGSIGHGQYYLIQEAGGNLGASLPTPDAVGTIAMSATNGKVALVSSTVALNGACPILSSVTDMVGYGTANCFEGTGAAPPLSTTLAALRGADGCTDANDNAADFSAGSPTPRNSNSPAAPCGPVPIRLSYFSCEACAGDRSVLFRWGTISETNNYGFQIQKSVTSEGPFETLPQSFVPGHGTTLLPQHYTFVLQDADAAESFYRLLQIDLDGSCHYSDALRAAFLTWVPQHTNGPNTLLSRNFPNPFNASTLIPFTLTQPAHVRVGLFNILGEEVALVFNGNLETGVYTLRWDAGEAPAGVYLCRLESNGTVETLRLVLLR